MLPKKINPEAEKAIKKANKLGFAFAINQMQNGGTYKYTVKTKDNGLWEKLTFKLYKVADGWKIAINPVFTAPIRRASIKVGVTFDAVWFKP